MFLNSVNNIMTSSSNRFYCIVRITKKGETFLFVKSNSINVIKTGKLLKISAGEQFTNY